MGMKQILVMMAVGLSLSVTADEVVITDPAIKAYLGRQFKKPYGEFAPQMKLTKAETAEITSLELSDTKITDEGLKDLAKLQNLKTLFLGGTKITDAGLKEVTKLQKLKWLDLVNTQITDAGLKELVKLRDLQLLDLYGTKITDTGFAELEKAMPNCKIYGP